MGLSFAHLEERLANPTKSQNWEGVEVVDHFKKYFDVPVQGPWGYAAWLRRIKSHKITMYHAKRLIDIMLEREHWLRTNKQIELHRGKWMFNRFREDIKTMGIDRFISHNSR